MNTVTAEQVDSILEKLEAEYLVVPNSTVTLCVLFLPMPNGNRFSIATGLAACIDPANFKEEVGRQYSFKDAFAKARSKIWELEGYALAKTLQA